MMSIPPLLAQLRSGRLLALAITAPQRSPLRPGTPTGLGWGLDFEGISGSGLFAPAGTPAPVFRRPCTVTAAALSHPQLRSRFSAMGQDISQMGMPPEMFQRFYSAERAK